MSGTLSPSATPAREGLENCSEIANVEGGGGWESFFMLSLGGGGADRGGWGHFWWRFYLPLPAMLDDVFPTLLSIAFCCHS